MTLIYKNEPISMGTKVGQVDEGSRIETFSCDIAKEAQLNRLLLRKAMLLAGFAPFDGEWWHFSYGDREWAYYYNQPYAIYDKM